MHKYLYIIILNVLSFIGLIFAYYLKLNVLLVPAAILFVALSVLLMIMRNKQTKSTGATYLFYGTIVLLIFLPPSLKRSQYMFWIILGTIYYAFLIYEILHSLKMPNQSET